MRDPKFIITGNRLIYWWTNGIVFPLLQMLFSFIFFFIAKTGLMLYTIKHTLFLMRSLLLWIRKIKVCRITNWQTNWFTKVVGILCGLNIFMWYHNWEARTTREKRQEQSEREKKLQRNNRMLWFATKCRQIRLHLQLKCEKRNRGKKYSFFSRFFS